MSDRSTKSLALALIPTGIALNIALGTLVSVVKLPIFMDAVGTIIVTLLIGWRAGVVVGVVSFLLMAVLVNPAYVYFIGTQACIALVVYVFATRLRSFRSLGATIATGVAVSIVAAIVSAPVIVLAFGGVAGSGRDLITAVLMNSGTQIVKAVLLSGAASEPIDKTLQVLLAASLIRTAPRTLIDRFQSGIVRANGYLNGVKPKVG